MTTEPTCSDRHGGGCNLRNVAIDFMIMPLSRYLSGDFVTPVMRQAWEQGVPYKIFGPNGQKDCPPGLPFGGAGATEHRAAIQGELLRDLQALPQGIASRLWEERSSDEPRFHRVDPTSFGLLLDRCKSDSSAKPSLWKRLAGHARSSSTTHLLAGIYLPVDFETPFQMSTPIATLVGSVVRAREELDAHEWPAGVEEARVTLAAALADSAELRFPMIVDR